MIMNQQNKNSITEDILIECLTNGINPDEQRKCFWRKL